MKWTDDEKKVLIEKYSSSINLMELGNQLNKSVRAIKHKAARLGLSRGRAPVNKPKNKNYRKKVDKFYYENNKKKIYDSKVRRLKNRKINLINILGGKCSKCGYHKCVAALEFHHNGGNKEGNIAHIIKNFSQGKALKEIKKCILLCANCHREIHHKGISDNA